MRVFGLGFVAFAALVVPGAAEPRAAKPVLVSVRGTCDHLRVGKRDATAACNPRVILMTAGERLVFVFGSSAEDENDGDATVVFGGRGPIVDVGAGKRAQAVGMVGFTYKGRSDPDQDAVGVCEYTDLYAGVAHVACSAAVDGGRRFEAGFKTDGAKPKRL